jgi:hypothetical protein
LWFKNRISKEEIRLPGCVWELYIYIINQIKCKILDSPKLQIYHGSGVGEVRVMIIHQGYDEKVEETHNAY